MRSFDRIVWMALAAVSIAVAQDDPPGRVARLNYVQGPVSFQPAGVDDWVPAIVNRPMTTGDQLWVDQNGRAEMHIGSAALRLSSGTAFNFLNLTDDNVQISLAQGSIQFRVRFLDDNQTFEVDTPNLAFSVLRPGVYRVDANPDAQATIVTVRSGQGEGTGGGQAIPVGPGQQARINGDQTVSVNMGSAPQPDWFDQWAVGRDRRVDTSQSARYCSRYVIGYEDLDGTGDWRPGGEYGTVWFPHVAAGWAPYRNGHWAWIDPWGWTWVDDAPWGFAPFHYGRWAVVGGAWGWIPGPVAQRPVYAPALVAWVGGSGFSVSVGGGGGGVGVGWFPLGPREVFVPSYHVSPVYVNRVNVSNTTITNVNITNINVTNVHYVNQSAPNAVTVVTRETFVNAQPVAKAVVVVKPEMIAHAQVMQNTQFAPSRQAVLGHPTVTASAARPPAAVLSRQVVAKATPPPPPVPFAQREKLLQQNPGRPLQASQVQQIRAQQPAAAQHPVAVRQAAPVNRAPAGQPAPQPGRPASPQANNPARPTEVRPVPQNPTPQEMKKPAPTPQTNPPGRPIPQNQPPPEVNRPARPANPEVKTTPAAPTPKPQEERKTEPAPRPANPEVKTTPATPTPKPQEQRRLEPSARPANPEVKTPPPAPAARPQEERKTEPGARPAPAEQKRTPPPAKKTEKDTKKKTEEK